MMQQEDFVFTKLKQVVETLIQKIADSQRVEDAEKHLDLLLKVLDKLSEREREQEAKRIQAERIQAGQAGR